jgi:hypothetical protein
MEPTPIEVFFDPLIVYPSPGFWQFQEGKLPFGYPP